MAVTWGHHTSIFVRIDIRGHEASTFCYGSYLGHRQALFVKMDILGHEVSTSSYDSYLWSRGKHFLLWQ